MMDVEGRIVLVERFDALQEQVSNDLYGSELKNTSEKTSRSNGYIVFPIALLTPCREKVVAVGGWAYRWYLWILVNNRQRLSRLSRKSTQAICSCQRIYCTLSFSYSYLLGTTHSKQLQIQAYQSMEIVVSTHSRDLTQNSLDSSIHSSNPQHMTTAV